MRKGQVSSATKLFFGTAAIVISLAYFVAGGLPAAHAGTPQIADRHKAVETLDLAPAVFVENTGQWDSGIRYGFDGRGTKVSFTDAGPVFGMLGPSSEKGRASSAVFAARFVGARSVAPVGVDASTSRTNYYVGSDSSKWRTDVPSYSKIAYRGIYEGVDLCAWGRRSGLKYEFHVAPGASWRQIIVRYDGIDGLSVDEKGALHVATFLGEMVDNAPIVYQKTPEGHMGVDAHFRLVDSCSYGFEITDRVDSSLPLVIDPVIVWASYFGGNNDEPGGGMWMDSAGNVGIGAATLSTNFPTTSGVMQRTFGGGSDLIMAKFSGAGTLLWATYFGGDGNDEPSDVVMDSSNNVWIAGTTDSSDFPVTGGAFQSSSNGGVEAFIAKISSSGTLLYASFYGGSGDDQPARLARDGSDNCWMAGTTDSTDFPLTVSPFQNEIQGGTDVFVVKFSSTGSRLFASYLGGGLDDSASDEPNGVGIDSTGDLWITGQTVSTDFPLTSNAFAKSLDGDQDGFICKIGHTGTLAFSTYAGRLSGEYGKVLVDSTGSVYAIGGAGPGPLSTTLGAFQPDEGGMGDAFIQKITPQGALAWASYFGGSGSEWIQSATIDSSGSLWLAGSTGSADLPGAAGTTQPNLDGVEDAFVARITPQGGLAWSTYIGGSDREKAKNIAVDVFGNAWVSGATLSTDFPATPNAFQTAPGGGLDGFLAKVSRAGQREWATYLGGAGTDGGDSYDGGDVPIVADSSGNAWVATQTNSTNMTTSPGSFQTAAQGGWDFYAAKISAPEITSGGLPSATVGRSYSNTLTARAGTQPYTWSVHVGTLPPGLSLVASTGVVSGTPTATGAWSLTVRVTDAAGAWENKPLVMTAAEVLAITTAGLPAGTVGAAYNRVIDVAGGVPPYSRSVISGSLPAGLRIDGLTGAVSGTPTAAGTSSFTVRVSDTASSSVTKGYSIVIHAAPNITTSSLAGGTVGVAYSQTLAVTGGTSPLSWSISNSSLPSGLSLGAATGVISGTPNTSGTSNFTVRLQDTAGATTTKPLSITICAAPVITTTSLPNGTRATAYSNALAATGGKSPLAWSLQAGALPTGLSLNGSTGVISGTPSATGSWGFTAKVTDANSASATKALSISVYAGVGITTSSLPADTVGIAYSQTLAAGGGVEPYAWAIHAGSLPAGLSLDTASGTISGTPSAAGTSNFTVRVTDNVSASGTKALSIVINPIPSVTTTSLPAGVMGGAYSQTLASAGGTAPIIWSVSDGSLPAGLSLGASSGKISGTPNAAGTSSFTVTATDGVGATGTVGLSIVINAALAIVTDNMADGTIDVEYSQTARADGGIAPYAWSVISGSLPAGLTLDASSGEIAGIPTALTFSKFTLKVKDSQSTPRTATRSFTINVYPAAPSVDANWLEITKFQLGLPATSSGHDSFSLKGSFNMWPGGTVPKTVLLGIGDWSITVDASAWKNSGKTRVCTARQNGVNCKVTYWVGGTSKCTFQFTGAMQSLKGSIPAPVNNSVVIPVGLRAGEDFEMSAQPTMTVKGSVVKLAVPDELPFFFPQKMSVTRNARLRNRDGFSFTAKVGLDGDFNPLTDDFYISFGGLEINLPAGTMPVAVRRVAKFTATGPQGKLSFQLNNVTHLLTIKLSSADLSMAEQDVVIHVAVGNHGNPEGDFELFMSRNKSGSLLKY